MRRQAGPGVAREKKIFSAYKFLLKTVVACNTVSSDAPKPGTVVLCPSKVLSSSSEPVRSKSETLKLRGHAGGLPVSRGRRAHPSLRDRFGFVRRRHTSAGLAPEPRGRSILGVAPVVGPYS